MRCVSGHEMPEHVVYTLLSDVHFPSSCYVSVFPYFKKGRIGVSGRGQGANAQKPRHLLFVTTKNINVVFIHI